MILANPARLTLLLSAGALVALNAQGPLQAGSSAAPEPRPRVAVAGEALKTVLPRLGEQYDVRLGAGTSLAAQRVTLYGQGVGLDTWTEGLVELLSVKPDGRVFWNRPGDSGLRRLESSRQRAELAARLRDSDQAYYRELLEKRLAWARDEGPRALAAAGEDRQPIILEQLGACALIEHLGQDGLERLLAGDPVAVPFHSFEGTPREPLFRRWIEQRRNPPAGLPPGPGGARPALRYEDLRDYTYVLLRERNPFDPQFAGITTTLVRPSGFASTIAPVMALRPPGVSRASRLRKALFDPLRLKVPLKNEAPDSPRVSLNLTPEPGAAMDATVERNMDDLLATAAEALGLTIIADGYLRPSVPLAANLEVRDCPLERLLTRLAEAWDCDWRFLDPEKRTVLFRARFWWLEDQADVPEDVVKELRERLGPEKWPRLEDLLRLSELTDAQVRKLTEDTGLCAAADEILFKGMYNGLGAKDCFRFFNRLPEELKKRALSPEGLPLALAPPGLVEGILGRTLVGFVGAITPERRKELLFILEPVRPDRAGEPPPGFQVRIRSARLPGCNWFHMVRRPRPRPDRPTEGRPTGGRP